MAKHDRGPSKDPLDLPRRLPRRYVVCPASWVKKEEHWILLLKAKKGATAWCPMCRIRVFFSERTYAQGPTGLLREQLRGKRIVE